MQEKSKILIIVGAVLHNKGSEALVRGLCGILNKHDGYNLILCTNDNIKNKFQFKEVHKFIVKKDIDNNNFLYRCLRKLSYILELRQWYPYLRYLRNFVYRTVLDEARAADLVIVVGADNFDSAYNEAFEQEIFNIVLKRFSQTNKHILYDCSLNKSNLNEKRVKNLDLYDLITARDQITLGNFVEVFAKRKVEYYPDPAFTMSKSVELDSLQYKGAIGINLSNLVLDEKYGGNKEIAMHSYVQFVQYLLNLNKRVVLFPHVMNNADLSVLRYIYNNIPYNTNLVLIENELLNAPELKKIISSFEFVVTSRTHASIAAYSEFIPTLVIGYSIKSKGIARDLFGTDRDFVLEIDKIHSESDLIKAFEKLYCRKQEIIDILHDRIPSYQNAASSFYLKVNDYVREN